MLGKCANPSCSAFFCHLGEGMLFQLEPDPALRLPTPQTPEYNWLCLSCSTALTLHVDAQGTVVTAPLPVEVQSASANVVTTSIRQGGLLLCNVGSCCRHL